MSVTVCISFAFHVTKEANGGGKGVLCSGPRESLQVHCSNAVTMGALSDDFVLGLVDNVNVVSGPAAHI